MSLIIWIHSRLPLPGVVDEEAGAVIVEVEEFNNSEDGFEDIPRDQSGLDQAGFRYICCFNTVF